MSLVSRRLLDRDGARFRLGVHLFELGGRVPLHRQLREAAAPYLEMLYERTRQVIHFAIPEQGDALYLDKVARQNTLHLVTHQGARLPLHCTAIGKALLAYLPPESLYEAFNRKLDRRTPRTLVTRQLILEQLAEIRRTGVAFEIEESARNIACAASPVLGRDGFAIAAVSVTSSALAFDLSRFGPAVKATAAELRRVLDSSPSQSPARDAPSSVSVVANALRGEAVQGRLEG
jgi:DNA-binding IclR family transcriptional regulator